MQKVISGCLHMFRCMSTELCANQILVNQVEYNLIKIKINVDNKVPMSSNKYFLISNILACYYCQISYQTSNIIKVAISCFILFGGTYVDKR